MEAWAEGFPALAAACDALGFADAAKGRLLVIAEELFTNAVKYGLPVDGSGAAHLLICEESGAACLVYEDDGAPFDLTSASIDPEPLSGMEDRPEGRMGLRLIFGLARSVSYDRADGRNRLRIVLPPG